MDKTMAVVREPGTRVPRLYRRWECVKACPFTRLRDSSPVFDRCKEIGDVGIPAFVFEDGRVSIDPADAGLIEYGSPAACSIEDHKNGRKGC